MTSSYLPWVALALVFCGLALAASKDGLPPYVKQCKGKDPNLTTCVIGILHHIAPFLRAGIPEIKSPTVEPFLIDELALSLTSGPQGYKITLKEMEVYGISNYTVTDLKLAKNGAPFEAMIKIPRLTMTAEYTSSGVLLILPASGHGIFHNTMKDVTAFVNGTVRFRTTKKGNEHMRITRMDLLLDCKTINMYIDKAFLNAPVLREATNLFLKENGKEVLEAMRPQLNQKLSVKFMEIGNNVLRRTPINLYVTDN